ncbi:MAG: hypothetical protein RL338_1737 [Chloroflexota bacterium]|jgi:N-acetylglucosamine kinase-like BadF-type ATPase
MSPASPAAILAVDGGNSKTDVALVGRDGSVLGVARGGSGSYHAVGMRRMIETIRGTARAAAREGGLDPDALAPEVGVYCLAGADLPVDDRRLGRAIGRAGLAAATIVRNDAFAGLRAGTSEGWGISLVCGTGMNCAGVGPDGRVVRFPALGSLSGDEGGGADLAVRALGAAIHGRDGRGPRTSLERLVPGHFGLRRPLDVVVALHVGRITGDDVPGLAPVVFSAAAAGDAVARGLADWQADRLVAIGASAIRRLGLARRPVEIVLIGSIWRTDDRAFHERFRAGLLAVAPQAIVRRLDAPPVLGAALLGADRLGLGPAALARLSTQLTAARIERAAGHGR